MRGPLAQQTSNDQALIVPTKRGFLTTREMLIVTAERRCPAKHLLLFPMHHLPPAEMCPLATAAANAAFLHGHADTFAAVASLLLAVCIPVPLSAAAAAVVLAHCCAAA